MNIFIMKMNSTLKILEKNSLNLTNTQLQHTQASLNFFEVFEKLRLTQFCLKFFCKTHASLVIFLINLRLVFTTLNFFSLIIMVFILDIITICYHKVIFSYSELINYTYFLFLVFTFLFQKLRTTFWSFRMTLLVLRKAALMIILLLKKPEVHLDLI